MKTTPQKDNSARDAAKQMLDSYLEQNNHRKTPERYAVLDAVYGIEGHFTLDELERRLSIESRFHVSRGTLYNCLRLFMELHLVVRHTFESVTKYEACRPDDNHIHQICTVCGRLVELPSPTIAQAVSELPLGGFRSDGFSLYIYGVCAECQDKIKYTGN